MLQSSDDWANSRQTRKKLRNNHLKIYIQIQQPDKTVSIQGTQTLHGCFPSTHGKNQKVLTYWGGGGTQKHEKHVSHIAV